MAYKSNSSKFWTGFLAVLLALVLAGTAALVGVLSDGFKDWSKFKPDEEQTEQTDETAENGGALIGESVGNGVKVLSTKIATADYSAYGISPMAETAYQLTATITPSDATVKTVDWTIAFKNPSSSWATGKTVTDYVTVTPTSDGSLTANVECLQAFGEQIKVTVTSRQNTEATASCTVDYAQKLESTFVTFKANSSLSGDKDIVLNEIYDGSPDDWVVFDCFLSASSSNKKTPVLTYNSSDVYTLAEEYTTTISITPSQALVQANPSVVKGSYDATNGFCPNQEFLNTILGESFATNSGKILQMATFFEICAVSDAIKVIVTTSCKYSENVVSEFSIAFSSDSVGVAVNDVSLNNSTIVF